VDAVILQIFVSLALVVGSLLLFAFSVKQRDHEESHRLALFPLDADDGRAPEPGPESAQSVPTPPREKP
jgi:hypothetical protein